MQLVFGGSGFRVRVSGIGFRRVGIKGLGF